MVNSKGHGELKKSAEEQMERVRGFLERMEDLVMRGGEADLDEIRRYYHMDKGSSSSSNINVTENKFVRFGIRKQIEVEIYVPLRSTLSKAIVNGWRFEDVQVSTMMRKLRNEDQTFFKIPVENQRSCEWKSACEILRVGAKKTLPCEKLAAIVDCAEEITKLHGLAEEVSQLTADDLVPIFIFVVVRSDVERPLSLISLLQNVCNSDSRIGEMGYYLSTFEAAINYVQMLMAEDSNGEGKNTSDDGSEGKVGLEFEAELPDNNASIEKVTRDMNNALQETGFIT